MIRRASDCTRLFELNGLSFLTSTIFSGVYKNLEAITISNNGVWRAYIPVDSVEKAGEEGARLYGSTKNYEQYKLDLESAYEVVRDTCDARFAKEKMTAEDVRDCIAAATNYLRQYQKTEFFFTDKAFEQRAGNPEMEQNLLSFGDFKLRGREYLNTIYFGEHAYFNRLVEKVASDLAVPTAELWSFSTDELASLYSGVSSAQIDRTGRSEAFCSWYEGGELTHAFGAEAKKHIAEFLGEVNSQAELRGRIANKGKVTAKARVFNYALSEFDQAYKWVEAMQQGEVLVAETTSPEIILACKKASAIVTNQGGMMSHAAIVSRELGIPCIVGTGMATSLIATGDTIEVDADQGTVRVLEKAPR